MDLIPILILAGIGCSPSLKKAIACLEGRDRFPTQILHWWFQEWTSGSDHVSISTVSLQMPSCSSWGCAPMFFTWIIMGMLVILLCPILHVCRFDGLGSTSYTAWMRFLHGFPQLNTGNFSSPTLNWVGDKGSTLLGPFTPLPAMPLYPAKDPDLCRMHISWAKPMCSYSPASLYWDFSAFISHLMLWILTALMFFE